MMSLAGLFIPGARDGRNDVRVREAVRSGFEQVRADVRGGGDADRGRAQGHRGLVPGASGEKVGCAS